YGGSVSVSSFYMTDERRILWRLSRIIEVEGVRRIRLSNVSIVSVQHSNKLSLSSFVRFRCCSTICRSLKIPSARQSCIASCDSHKQGAREDIHADWYVQPWPRNLPQAPYARERVGRLNLFPNRKRRPCF